MIRGSIWRVRVGQNFTQVLDQMAFDGAYVADLLDWFGDSSYLFAGNSLPVRHVDQFGKPNVKMIHVFANRGASGIDGNVSSGMGIAAKVPDPTTILTGDITFYHDSNGLLALRHLNAKTSHLWYSTIMGAEYFNDYPSPDSSLLSTTCSGFPTDSISPTLPEPITLIISAPKPAMHYKCYFQGKRPRQRRV